MLPTGEEWGERLEPGLDRYKKRYQINEINLLNVGDILLLHSDGLTEHDDHRYFPERLERLLVACRDESAEGTSQRLREDLLACAEPQDDISAVVIRKTS
jgi:serine phosphatase RsbU (regulator of sigma subunit)